MNATWIPLLVAGWFAWTLGEYVLHRFAMHALKGKGLASREHLTHHAQRDSVLEKWALSWAGVVVVGIALGVVIHPAVGIGWVGGYGFYDLQHYRAHRRAPRTRYQRWLRRHHFHHHFGHPMENHGVTWSLWDHVFGTYRDPGVVRVPRRMAMVWLLDDDGAVRPEHAGDYEVVGRAPASDAQAAIDRARAFANQAPVLT
ncbi:MAG: sterol desaturase family protein [Acidimicrobiia bacterium]|nr:sterol desaturase family protein [Acidimicrobiia bacterium]